MLLHRDFSQGKAKGAHEHGEQAGLQTHEDACELSGQYELTPDTNFAIMKINFKAMLGEMR